MIDVINLSQLLRSVSFFHLQFFALVKRPSERNMKKEELAVMKDLWCTKEMINELSEPYIQHPVVNHRNDKRVV